jgi:hypothetical protein
LKFLQIVLNCISLALLAVAIVVVVALMPSVQTWWVQSQLTSQPGVHGTVDGVSARFGEVEIINLHLNYQGAKLTLPGLEAGIPLSKSAWTRSFKVKSLVAKGWTLDLTHYNDAAVAPSLAVTQALAGLLAKWELPCEATVDGVDLEGDVLMAAPPGTTPARIHVVVSGGGMAAGREGSFAVDLADYDPRLPADVVMAHGTLTIAMDTPRTISKVGLKADLSTRGGSLPENLSLAADASATREQGAQVFRVALTRAGHPTASVLARLGDSTGKIAGTWSVDVKDSDLALFTPNATLPPLKASGEGSFDADTGFGRTRVVGHLHTVASHLGVLAAPLDSLGTVAMDSQFDLTQSGSKIRFDQCSVALGGAHPTVAAKLVQPFSADESTGRLTLDNPDGDWVEASATRVPLAWLTGLLGKLSFAGGEATGTFLIKQSTGGYTFHPEGMLAASGVYAQVSGRTVLRGADLSASVIASYDSKGWQADFSPLAVSGAGRVLVTFHGKASEPMGEDQQVTVAGAWSANPEAIAAGSTIPGLGWIRGRTASGDITATVSSWGELDTKFVLGDVVPGTSISGTGHADIGLDGSVSFVIPVKVSSGKDVSDLSAEGEWTADAAGPHVEAKLAGQLVLLDHLRLLAGPVAAARGGNPAPSGGGRDRVPFWGNWSGRVVVDIDHLKALDHDFTEATGRLDWDQEAFHLKNGRAVYARHNLAKLEGSLSFDPAAPQPYSLDATAEASDFDASKYFRDPQFGSDPFVDGHFSVSATSAGKGRNLGDLTAGARNVLLLHSTGGIVRFLKTSVAEAIPEAPTKVTDTLGKVGSTVGSIFGSKPKERDTGSNPVNKNAESILDFTYAASEIGYDDLTVTAMLGADRTIHLTNLAITAPEERVTGSGEINYVEGLPLRQRPLSLDLVLSVRGDTGNLLSNAGLLSETKDDLGYKALVQPLHFGGTLAHLDASQWHELLVKAATRRPDAEKKAP